MCSCYLSPLLCPLAMQLPCHNLAHLPPALPSSSRLGNTEMRVRRNGLLDAAPDSSSICWKCELGASKCRGSLLGVCIKRRGFSPCWVTHFCSQASWEWKNETIEVVETASNGTELTWCPQVLPTCEDHYWGHIRGYGLYFADPCAWDFVP